MSDTSVVAAPVVTTPGSSVVIQSHSSASSGSGLDASRKPSPIGETTFLPSGDCLPANFNLNLMKKAPMFPTPTGALELYTRKLAQAPFINKSRYDFDLSDPNNYCIKNHYNPLTDPHMIYYVCNPRTRKRLLELGDLTPDNKVRCTRKEYNEYSKWLQHVGQQQFKKQLHDEKKKAVKKKAGADPNLKVAIIETEIRQEISQSSLQLDDAQSADSQSAGRGAKTEQSGSMGTPQALPLQGDEGSQQPVTQPLPRKGDEGSLPAVTQPAEETPSGPVTQPDVKSPEEAAPVQSVSLADDEMVSRSVAFAGVNNVADSRSESQFESQSGSQLQVLPAEQQDEERALQPTKVNDSYIRATTQFRKRQKQQLNAYQERIRANIQVMKEAEEIRLENCAKKIKEGWSRPKLYTKQYEDPPVHSTEDQEARKMRFRKELGAELNRRWQMKAVRMKELKDRAREKHRKLEETYTRNLAKVFAPSPEQNGAPEQQAIEETPEQKEKPDTQLETSSPTIPTDDQKRKKGTRDALDTGSRAETDRLSLKSKSPEQSFEERKPSCSDVKQPIVRQESLSSKSSRPGSRFRESSDVKGSFGHRRRHGRLMTHKRMSLGDRSSSVYPTVVRQIKAEEKPPPGDEVYIFMPHELILQNTPGDVEAKPVEGKTEKGPGEAVIIQEPKEPVSEKEPETSDGLSDEERQELEEVLQRILKDLMNGRLDREDLMRLIACCSGLTQATLMEQATSTTSLTCERESRPVSDISAAASVTSAESGARYEEVAYDEQFGSTLVEESIRDAVCQLAHDLENGSLSREDVREIGSAVASVILGAIRSDTSMLEEQVVVPALEKLLREAEDIDEELLDRTMASLLSSYKLVSMKRDKYAWEIVKDFIVELLTKVKDAMTSGALDISNFLQKTEESKVAPQHQEMELPSEQEFLLVLSTAVTKLSAIEVFCPVLCDLMKIILDQGRAIYVERHEGENLALPHIDPSLLEQVGQSACGLEVVLEVAATVSDGLLLDMADNSQFEESLYLSLAPAFVIAILASWGELADFVPKETVASQTTGRDISYIPSMAENVILVSLNRIWRHTAHGEYPRFVVGHLILHLAEFPALTPLSTALLNNGEDNGSLPGYVKRKVAKLSQEVRDTRVTLEECKKLLAVVLYMYMREALLPEDQQPPPPFHLETEQDTCVNVIILIRDVVSTVLHQVHEEVTETLTSNNTTVPESGELLVMEVLQLMSDFGVMEMEDMLDKQLTSSLCGDAELNSIITATVSTPEHPEEAPPKADLIREFLRSICDSIEAYPYGGIQHSILDGDFKPLGNVIRRELGKVAKEMVDMLSDMAVLRQEQGERPGAIMEKMISFLVSLLVELRHAVSEDLLPPSDAFCLLKVVAGDQCPAEMEQDVQQQVDFIKTIIQDIRLRDKKSPYFTNLVRHLSKMSLELQDHEEVAEGMAATAHLLSSVDANILNKFIQTTLFSVLSSITKPDTQPAPPEQSADQATVSSDVKLEVVEPAPFDSTKASKGSSVDVGNASNLASLGPASSTDSEVGEESDSKQEISHEASIITQIAVQTVLERLGVDTGTTTPRTSAAADGLMQILSKALDVPSPAPDVELDQKFSDLDPSVNVYAQELLEDISRQMGEEEEASGKEVVEPPAICTNSIATIIINKTFKSIETGLGTGKVQVQECQDSGSYMSQEVPLVSVTQCITNTLCAVRSELDILLLPFDTDTDTDTDTETSQSTMERAIEVVNYLIQRLQTDAENAKVQFNLTKDQKLTVTKKAVPGKVGSKSLTKLSDVWQCRPDVLSDIVLKVFRKVLCDMHNQNQFFNPEQPENRENADNTDVIILPCLPFLLDELILCSLKHIAVYLSQSSTSKEPPLEPLTHEALMVGSAVQTVINSMITTCKQGVTDIQQLNELDSKRLTVLTILDEAFNRLPDGVSDSSGEVGHLQELSETVRKGSRIPASKQEAQSLKRTRSQVKGDVGKLLACISGVKASSLAEQKPDTESTSPSSDPRKEFVLSAIRQIITSVEENRVADDIVADLYETFLPNVPDLTPSSGKELLLNELTSLTSSISQGLIPGKRLVQAAEEISFLEKLPVDDPRRIAKVVRKLSAGFNAEYLKKAVADLLWGFQQDKEAAEAAGTPSEEEERPYTYTQQGRMSTADLRDILAKKKMSPSEEQNEEEVHLDKCSSIHARTISKICLWDTAENREIMSSAIYSTPVTFKSAPQLASFKDKDQTAIPELSETSSSRHRCFSVDYPGNVDDPALTGSMTYMSESEFSTDTTHSSLHKKEKEVAAVKTEEEEVAAGKTGEEEVAAGKTGEDEVAAGKTGEEEVAAVKTGEEEVAAGKTGEEEVAAQKTGEEEVAAQKTGEEEVAAVKTGEEEVAAVKTGEEEVAAQKTGEEEVAAQKTGEEEVAAETTGEEEVAAQKTEEEEVAAQKTGEEEVAAETTGEEEVAAQKTEEEEVAAVKTGEEEVAAETTGEEEVAAVKTGEEEVAAEKTGEEEVAAGKTGEEEVAAVKTGEEEVAAVKTGEEKVAAQKTGEEEVAAVKTGEEEVAAQKTGEEEVAAVKTGEEEVTAQKTEEEEVAAVKTGEEEVAAVNTGEEEVTAQKTGEEEVAAQKTGEEEVAAQKTEEEEVTAVKTGEEEVDAAKADDDGDQKDVGAVDVQRTESEISKDSGSKGSLEAPTEDWNRSAIRATRKDYVSRIDEVQEKQVMWTRQEPGNAPQQLLGLDPWEWQGGRQASGDCFPTSVGSRHFSEEVSDSWRLAMYSDSSRSAAIADTGIKLARQHPSKARRTTQRGVLGRSEQRGVQGGNAEESERTRERTLWGVAGDPGSFMASFNMPTQPPQNPDFAMTLHSHVSASLWRQQQDNVSHCQSVNTPAAHRHPCLVSRHSALPPLTTRPATGRQRRAGHNATAPPVSFLTRPNRQAAMTRPRDLGFERRSLSVAEVFNKHCVLAPHPPSVPHPPASLPSALSRKMMPGAYPQSLLMKAHSSPQCRCDVTPPGGEHRRDQVSSETSVFVSQCVADEQKAGSSHHAQDIAARQRNLSVTWRSLSQQASLSQSGDPVSAGIGKHVCSPKHRKRLARQSGITRTTQRNTDLTVESILISPLDLGHPSSYSHSGTRLVGRKRTESESCAVLPFVGPSAKGQASRSIQVQNVRRERRATARVTVSGRLPATERKGPQESREVGRCDGKSGTALLPPHPPTSVRGTTVASSNAVSISTRHALSSKNRWKLRSLPQCRVLKPGARDRSAHSAHNTSGQCMKEVSDRQRAAVSGACSGSGLQVGRGVVHSVPQHVDKNGPLCLSQLDCASTLQRQRKARDTTGR